MSTRDMTEVQKQALEKAHEAERAERSHELSMIDEVRQRAQHQDQVVDYFSEAAVPLPEFRDEEEDDSPFREVRIKYEIEQMAYGKEVRTETYVDDQGVEHEVQVPGNIRFFDFEEGRKYRLPREMANYLDVKGYVMH